MPDRATNRLSLGCGLALLVTTVMGCSGGDNVNDNVNGNQNTNQNSNQNANATLSELAGQAWTFQVTHLLDRSTDPTLPDLTDENYRAVENGPFYDVSFTPDATGVLLEMPGVGDDIWGRLGEATPDRVHYDLTEGVMAGGRFVVWPQGGGLRAELTIYGSGVPIIDSQRGDLTRVQ